MLTFGVALVVASAASVAHAQPQYSGDLNDDLNLDVADVVTMTDVNATTEVLSGREAILGDADQSSVYDEDDVQYVVDVLVGLRVPLPLKGFGRTGLASFWKQPSSEDYPTTYTNFRPGLASFWRQTDPASEPTTDANVRPGVASFWYLPVESPSAEVTDANVRQLQSPSFDRQ